jgi:carboxymethylenebutenolidase
MSETAVEIKTADGVADGFLYRPAGQGTYPGVIQLTDIGGVRAANRELAQRVADQGYLVLMPNVFYRTGKFAIAYPLKMGDPQTMKRMEELRTPLTPQAMESDTEAYVDCLAAQPGVKSGPVGVVGYCFTGAMAMRAAAARPAKVAACASFHGGRLYTADPGSPHTALPRIKARLYFGHAVQDNSMPADAIEKFEQALAAWGGRYESETYENSFHSWTTTDSPVYNAPQAERAFAKLMELFAATLK